MANSGRGVGEVDPPEALGSPTPFDIDCLPVPAPLYPVVPLEYSECLLRKGMMGLPSTNSLCRWDHLSLGDLGTSDLILFSQRFTGNQIAKIYQQNPEAYSHTEVSSMYRCHAKSRWKWPFFFHTFQQQDIEPIGSKQ